MASMALEVAVI